MTDRRLCLAQAAASQASAHEALAGVIHARHETSVVLAADADAGTAAAADASLIGQRCRRCASHVRHASS